MSGTYRAQVDVEASCEAVFDHFLKPELLVRWMGDVARLEARDGGLFSVDINGVLIRGHFVRIERPRRLEIAWGEAGSSIMPPGATRLIVTFETHGTMTRVVLEHRGLVPGEATKHAIGWPHFMARLSVAATGEDPGPDPWRISPPGGVQD
jgi:uncharacterized protein YndB with AHSA1/START domain